MKNTKIKIENSLSSFTTVETQVRRDSIDGKMSQKKLPGMGRKRGKFKEKH